MLRSYQSDHVANACCPQESGQRVYRTSHGCKLRAKTLRQARVASKNIANMPDSFQIPDLAKLCNEHFELRANQHCRAASDESHQWVRQRRFLKEAECTRLPDAQVGLLAALCIPTCDMPQLQTATDLLTLLFYWHDKPDAMDEPAFEAALQSAVERMTRQTSEDWQARFQGHLAAFHDAQRVRAQARHVQPSSTVDTCLAAKRTSEPFNLGFDAIEYAEGLNVTDATLNSRWFKQLRLHALDAVIWMKDIVSYNTEQARGDLNNLIAVLMAQRQITRQAAVNQATDALQVQIRGFVNAANNGETAASNSDERRYVQGIRDWIVGWAHWVYETDRYFLKNGEDVKVYGWVFVLQKEGEGGER